MFLSLQQFRPGYRATRRWLWCNLLAIFLVLFSAAAFSRGTVLFEDHFDDETSLGHWDFYGNCVDPSAQVIDQQLVLTASNGPGFFCGGSYSAYVLLKQAPELNFDFSITVGANAHIIFRATNYSEIDHYSGALTGSYTGQAYILDLERIQNDPLRIDHLTLTRIDSGENFYAPGNKNKTLAAANFDPVSTPTSARIVANDELIRIYVEGKLILATKDLNPLPAGQIGLGVPAGRNASVHFDDATLKALPDLRCGAYPKIDGTDPICRGGLFEHTLKAYLGPDDRRIAQVDFHLDGKYRRSEYHAPWELDGGSATLVATGPHEIKANVRYKDGSRKIYLAGFEVGEHSLRCSPDPILDGNDAACEGGAFDGPTWVYWWPSEGVKSIDYYVNDSLHRTDRLAPFELDGGAASALGGVSIKTVVRFSDGRTPLTGLTRLTWNLEPERALLCSSDEVTDGSDYDCRTFYNYAIPEPMRAYLWPEDGIQRVEFYVDGKFRRTERYAPYELDGGSWTDLSGGSHDITAIVHYADRNKPTTAFTTQVYATQ